MNIYLLSPRITLTTLTGLLLVACSSGVLDQSYTTTTDHTSQLIDNDNFLGYEHSDSLTSHEYQLQVVSIEDDGFYLDKPIPACSLQVFESVNPCPIEVSSGLDHDGQILFGELPTYTEVMLGYDTPGYVNHIVVRGVVLPSSTRCEVFPLAWFSFWDPAEDADGSFRYLCFAEVAVTEYIVGTGPPVLTVTMEDVVLIRYMTEGGSTEWWQLFGDEFLLVPQPQDPGPEVASAFEGKEVVLFLGLPVTNRVETWSLLHGRLSFWFLQKHGGEVRAVSAYYNEANPSDRSKLDIPLTELVAEIKKADAERDRITGGRLIVTPDTDAASAAADSNTPQPMIVTDANKLKDLYLASGAVYEGEDRTVLPPLPPEGYTPPPTTIVTTTSTTTTTAAATGLTLSISDATATEGEVMVFNVSLNKEPLSVRVAVNYTAHDVTAESGSDYTAPRGTFTFSPYETVKTVKVHIRDDTETEGTETFHLTLSQAWDATIQKATGIGTITDND